MTPRTHAVMGTAGHVDHGKTSLVEALTGTDGDRLAEEKRRGMTIDLGFTRWDLPAASLSIVDVPGHERFVQTMVAGASAFDLVALVVAADDGVMPQTREHLAICEQLGIGAGIVIVTKIDLADDEMLELVMDDVAEATRGTFLEDAEVVRCSVRQGRGLDDVARAVERVLTTLEPSHPEGAPWLPVDRVFTKHGFGTIVTGTLLRGTIATGDRLEVMPTADGDGKMVDVRGMSIHDGAVDAASATTRLALNLRGADRRLFRRGSVLTAPGAQRPTRAMDAELHLFADAPPLGPRTELVLHVGTAHRTVRVRALSSARIEPGERGIVRLLADRPLALYSGQRFILRRPGLETNRTVGGGTILDPHPGLVRRRGRSRDLSALVAGDGKERIAAMIRESLGGATIGALRQRMPPGADVSGAVEGLLADGVVVRASIAGEPRLFSRTQLERAQASVLESLASFHREHPVASGATVAELGGRLPPRLRPLAGPATDELRRQGRAVGGERVRLPGHDTHVLCDRVVDIYQRAGLEAGSDDEVREAADLDDRTFRELLAELDRAGQVVRLASGVHFHRSALEEVRARVAAHFEEKDTLSPGEIKSLTGLTRRRAIALLEWLDREGVTRRRGDLRVSA